MTKLPRIAQERRDWLDSIDDRRRMLMYDLEQLLIRLHNEERLLLHEFRTAHDQIQELKNLTQNVHDAFGVLTDDKYFDRRMGAQIGDRDK